MWLELIPQKLSNGKNTSTLPFRHSRRLDPLSFLCQQQRSAQVLLVAGLGGGEAVLLMPRRLEIDAYL